MSNPRPITPPSTTPILPHPPSSSTSPSSYGATSRRRRAPPPLSPITSVPVDLASRARADLEAARRAAGRDSSRREALEGVRDRYILGCSMLFMVSVVCTIIVSGIATMLAKRSLPKLEVDSDWPDGGIIPKEYGCLADGKGGGISIPLRWKNVPKGATNLAVLFAHPGAIKEKHIDPVHWFITNIKVNEGESGEIPANASMNLNTMPEGAIIRKNFHHAQSYWPPCHRNGTSFFVVHVWAVEAEPIIDDFDDAREIINRFVGVPVAKLTGHYGNQEPLPVEGYDSNDDHDDHDDIHDDQQPYDDSHSESEDHQTDEQLH